jgi:peptide/nickel transport system substrate-binding protein
MKIRFLLPLVVTLCFATQLLAMPKNSNPLSDSRVRQAIAYAIDMDTIQETLLEGKAIVADSHIPNGPFKKPGLPKYAYDPDKARQLLKEANWNSSQELDMVYYYGDQLTVDLMTAIQAYLGDVGIKMNFRRLEGDVGAQLWTAPKDPKNGPSVVKWDLAYGAHGPLALQEYFSRYKTGDMSISPADAKVDSMIDVLTSTADIAAQKKIFFEMEDYMQTELFTLPLYYQQAFIYESNKLNRNGGIYGNPQYNYDWDVTKWTVEPDANGKMVMNTNTGPMEFFEHPWFNPGLFITNKVLFDRLISCDGGLAPTRPKMAKYYNLSKDAKTLTFELKNGLQWHDGSAITAEEIKWNIELALKVPNIMPIFKTTFSYLEGAEAFMNGSASSVSGIAISGNKITLSFAQVDPNVLLTFTQWAPLPRKYLEDVDPAKFQQHPFWQNPVGSGPYKVQEVKMNDYLIMVPFENFHEGVARIDEIVAYPSKDNDANLVKNASAGSLDYGFTKNVADVKALEEMDHMRVIPADIPYTRMVWFNKYAKN